MKYNDHNYTEANFINHELIGQVLEKAKDASNEDIQNVIKKLERKRA